MATVGCYRHPMAVEMLRSGELMGQLELVADVLLVYWALSVGWLRLRLLTATVYRVYFWCW
jgi:hypothetical protein